MQCAYPVLPAAGTLGIIIARAPLMSGDQSPHFYHINVLIRSQSLKFIVNPTHLHKYFP